VYQFIWHEFCDWYIEMSKEALYGETEDKSESVACLLTVLENSLRMLHPFMPFVTEEIWQTLRDFVKDAGESIVVSPYPVDLSEDPAAEKEISQVIEAVTGIRNIRGEMNISPALEVTVRVKTFAESTTEVLMKNLALIRRLAKARDIEVGRALERPKGSATAVKDLFEIYVPLEGLLNIAAEIDRLMKEKRKVEESLSLLDKKLRNDDFRKRAPKEIFEKELAKHEELVQRDERLEKGIGRLKEVGVENG
ncbi:MAG TPA: class I tRNA ligase family protein, partial [Thermodesulfovibrionales bacterium]|nr:class I tRNA ligase family protein [Thermodesulfovibrionales bacterium]